MKTSHMWKQSGAGKAVRVIKRSSESVRSDIEGSVNPKLYI